MLRDLFILCCFILLVIICIYLVLITWHCLFIYYSKSKYSRTHSNDRERNGTDTERPRGRKHGDSSRRVLPTASTSRTIQNQNNAPRRGNLNLVPLRPQTVISATTTGHGQTKGIVTMTQIKTEARTPQKSAMSDVDLIEVRVDAKNQPPSVSVPPLGPMPMQTLRCTYVSINTESEPETSDSDFEQEPEPEPERKHLNSCSSNESSASNASIIIVGVDATPTNSGGYCIWLGRNEGKFYTVRKDCLPWGYDEGNPSEFEMKNALFALLKWTPLIVESKKLRFVTDNTAIKGEREEGSYGFTVRKYLLHLKTCCAVSILKEGNHHVHKGIPNEAFNKYILPADYLSRTEMPDFHHHMLANFPTILFENDHDLLKVQHEVDRWAQKQKPCPTCDFFISDWFIGRNKTTKRVNC